MLEHKLDTFQFYEHKCLEHLITPCRSLRPFTFCASEVISLILVIYVHIITSYLINKLKDDF